MRYRILLGALVAAGLTYFGCGGPGGSKSPAPPSNLSGTQMGGGIHLTWSDNSDNEDGFEVERASSSGTFAKIATVTFDTGQYHDQSGLTPGDTYAYRVRAVAGATRSSYSNEVSAIAPVGTGGGAGGGTGGGAGGGTGGGTGGGAGGGAGGGGGSDSLPDGGYSLQTHLVPIFNNSCGAGDGSCHSRIAYGGLPQNNCRGWLALENLPLGSKDPNTQASTGCPDRTLHQRLVELDAWMCGNPNRKYVVPGNLAASQLYQVMDPNADPSRGGQCMVSTTVPLGRMPKAPYTISAADINKVKVWIQQGAPNN